MALVVRIGTSYVTDSPVPQLHVSEQPGDAMVFPDTGTRDAFLAARGGGPAVVDTLTVSGQRNRSKRTSND